MNGDNSYQPGPDLPPPRQEAVNPLIPEQPVPPMRAETASQQAELPPAAGPAPLPPAPLGRTPFAPPMPAVPTQPQTPISIPVIDTPVTADDNDLIEKEWVNKAKRIVNASRQDPRLQNQEMNKLKADYIQKRYNKQLKVSED